MEIVLCSECGFIGNTKELLDATSLDGGIYINLIRRNGFSCRCCPMCKSTAIFYKSSSDIIVPSVNIPQVNIPMISSIKEETSITSFKSKVDDSKVNGYEYQSDQPGVNTTVDSVKDEDENIDPEILKSVLESINLPSVEEPKKKENIQKEKKEPTKPNRIMNTRAKRKFHCDLCNKEFQTKVDGATRCPNCVNGTLKKYVG